MEPMKKVITSGRTFEEYLAMFDLDVNDLLGQSILDCPGGAGEFNDCVAARGGDVISVDQVYGLSPTELAAMVGRQRREHLQHVGNAAGARYRPWFATWEAQEAEWTAAAHRFVASFTRDREAAENARRYVAAVLPDLPFPPGRFDLVLSSHLLFSYPDQISYADHLSYLLELMRVTNCASGRALVHPLVDSLGVRYPKLDELRRDLSHLGVRTEIVKVPYGMHQDGNHTLRCRWRKVQVPT